MQILKDLFTEIEDIKLKEFSGLNDLDFLEVDKINLPSINEDDIDLHELKLLFVKSKKESVEKLFETLDKLSIDENTRLVFVDFKQFILIMTEVKKRKKLKSLTIGVIKMLEICDEWLQAEKEKELSKIN